MTNYRTQKCCGNCNHVHIRSDYDCQDEYYCNITKDRPKDGVSREGEMFNYYVEKKDYIYDEHFKRNNIPDIARWNNWALKHRVIESGICDCWEG